MSGAAGVGALNTPGIKGGKEEPQSQFTDEEKKAIDDRTAKLMEEGKAEEDARSQATREAAATKLKCKMADGTPNLAGIEGGKYTAYDAGNGWFMLRDLPLISAFKKGVKGAPEDWNRAKLNDVVKFHTDSYKDGKIAYPIHEDHKDDMGIRKTRFAGYQMPKRVGLARVKGEDTPTVYGDIMVKPWVVEKMVKGELSYLSPEITNWKEPKLSSLALMDADAPYHPYPALTVAKIESAPGAAFKCALPKAVAKFSEKDGEEFITFEDEEDPEMAVKFEELEKRVTGLETGIGEIKDILKSQNTPRPNGANPVEQPEGGKGTEGTGGPGGAQMKDELSPAVAAKFASLESDLAKERGRNDERESKEKSGALLAKGMDALKGFQVLEPHKKYLAHFADKGDEKAVMQYVEDIKPTLAKEKGSTFSEAEEELASMSESAVSKFLDTPDRAEKAKKFADEYHRLKASPAGKFYDKSLEQHISVRMEMSKAGA